MSFTHTQVPVVPPMPITAGAKGATLLVWGVDAETLMTGISKA